VLGSIHSTQLSIINKQSEVTRPINPNKQTGFFFSYSFLIKKTKKTEKEKEIMAFAK
jgi:hypothetical protein